MKADLRFDDDELALRDAFAMAAMLGVIMKGGEINGYADEIASLAYIMADTMLKVRKP
jgi:hypothetical protein